MQGWQPEKLPASQRRLTLADLGSLRLPGLRRLYRRFAERNCRVSRATVYRNLKVLAAKDIIECHAFCEGRSRFRRFGSEHRDYLISVAAARYPDSSIHIRAFVEADRAELGYRLVDHRFEL